MLIHTLTDEEINFDSVGIIKNGDIIIAGGKLTLYLYASLLYGIAKLGKSYMNWLEKNNCNIVR